MRMLPNKLSGFLARKGGGKPGAKTVRIGRPRVTEIVIDLQFIRQAAHG